MRSGVFAVCAGGVGLASGFATVSGSLNASSAGLSTGGVGVGFASSFGAGSDLTSLIASATGSGFTSSFGAGSVFTSVAGTGIGFGSGWTTGFGSGCGSGLATGVSEGFGASAASTGFGLVSGVGLVSTSVSLSPTFCASGTVWGFCVGLGVGFSALGAFLSPFCSWLISETISIGIDSEFAISMGVGEENDKSPQPMTTAWIIAEDVTLARMVDQLTSGRLTRPIFLNPEPDICAMTFMIVP